MATHSSVLAWRIPGTGEPGGLTSVGSHRVGHDWSDLAAEKPPFFSQRSSHCLCSQRPLLCSLCSPHPPTPRVSRLWDLTLLHFSPARLQEPSLATFFSFVSLEPHLNVRLWLQKWLSFTLPTLISRFTPLECSWSPSALSWGSRNQETCTQWCSGGWSRTRHAAAWTRR